MIIVIRNDFWHYTHLTFILVGMTSMVLIQVKLTILDCVHALPVSGHGLCPFGADKDSMNPRYQHIDREYITH